MDKNDDWNYLDSHFECDECGSDYHIDSIIVRKFDNPFIEGEKITIILCPSCSEEGK